MCLAALAAQGVFLITIIVLRRKKKQRQAMLAARTAAAEAAAAAAAAASVDVEAGAAGLDAKQKGMEHGESKPSIGDADSAADPSEAVQPECSGAAAAAAQMFDDSVRGRR